MAPDVPEPPPETPRPGRLRRRLRALAILIVLLALATSPWWGPRAMSRMAFFRVRRIEIVGAKYLRPSDVIARLAVDSAQSVWQPLPPLEQRLKRHPQVADVHIARRLPGTLVVRVTENLPVAFVQINDTLVPVDSEGHRLPIDPSREAVDLPVTAARDSSVLALLAAARSRQPELFARISDVRRVAAGELLVHITAPTGELPVRATTSVSAERLADVVAVEADLRRRHRVASELDVRYRDQVIARLQ